MRKESIDFNDPTVDFSEPINPEVESILRARKPINRRDVLKLGALVFAGLVSCSRSGKKESDAIVKLAEETEYPDSPEKEKSPVKVGFNTHMRPGTEGTGESHTFEWFKREVDWLAQNEMDIVRLNLQEWDAVDNSISTKEHIVWNDEKIDVYKQALTYAKEKGLEVFFVVTPPTFATTRYTGDFDNYLEAIDVYYRGVAERFKGLVDIYQITNEPDDQSFYTYADINRTEQETEEEYKERYFAYVKELGRVVQRGSAAIKSVEPQVRTTVNVSKWVVPDPGIGYEEVAVFDAVCGYPLLGQTDGNCRTIDAVTIDFYPDLDQEEIDSLSDQVKYYNERYGLPVVIGEMGMPTIGQNTPEMQVSSVTLSIESLMSGIVLPESIIIYELRDQSRGDGTGNKYGIMNPDGTPKESFDPIVRKIRQYIQKQNVR